MGFFKFFPFIRWLVKERGCPSYISTAPIPFPEASSSIIKVFMNPGVAKIGALHMASLSCWKAWVVSGVQENASFFSNVVRGYVIIVLKKLAIVPCQN